MKAKEVIAETAVEGLEKASTGESTYQSPKIIKLGKASELIRGFYTYGWNDSREGYYSTGE